MSQRVLVTAGANGIGLAIAKAFAATGARVHIADINADAVTAVTAEHANITGTVGDISKASDVEKLFHDIRGQLGGLDVLVNNAGIAGPTAPVEDYDAGAFAAVVGVNLQGTFNITQRAIPLLKASEAGSIITMSSLAGRFGYPNRVGYSTTKWGLVGFAKTLAMELGQYGITSNTIHPGAVDGPRIMSVFEGRAAVSGRTVREEIDSAMANQSVKQFINPNDIAQLVLFLAGPHARTISGQMFPIDGDSKAAV
ncbi:SDR family oxidoreductase [Arthrobacter sp. I2-34]|uniref:SDR family oxidoreductase n=1 Tax=Arthrobacter hankyongi TaxID=2904801 RepID=A0ABS9LAF4_9MICC|nr:SDR family oxidoreductase [Arthrobacter hankyongi]MCG2623666.1 SDR family oxidoreductase [Arthrobacter hankyongi]